MKIYVGCGLTHSPAEFHNEVKMLKGLLRQKHEILDFVGLKGGTPRSVFEEDCRCVRECNMLLVICGYPSDGLGGEMMLAHTLNKPILAVAPHDALVSRFTQGYPPDRFSFARYRQISKVPLLVGAFIESFWYRDLTSDVR